MMQTTTFNGEAQEMVLPDGTPKGMKMVLEEGGLHKRHDIERQGKETERVQCIL